MFTITIPIWQKYYPEDVQSDDASTTTTTINDTDYNDTDVPSQRSDTDTSGTTTRSMSLPRLSGTTIRLPPEGAPSPSSSSSSPNKEKLEDKLMIRHDRDMFSTYLPLNFFPVSCGDKTRFSELCSQFGWHDSHLIQKGSLLPKGLQPEMGAQVNTWEGCPDEKVQKMLRNLEHCLTNTMRFGRFSHGNYNNFFLVGRDDMQRFDKFCDAKNDRDIFFFMLDLDIYLIGFRQSAREEIFAHISDQEHARTTERDAQQNLHKTATADEAVTESRKDAKLLEAQVSRHGAEVWSQWPNKPDRAEEAARKRRQSPADGGGSGSRVRQTEAT